MRVFYSRHPVRKIRGTGLKIPYLGLRILQPVLVMAVMIFFFQLYHRGVLKVFILTMTLLPPFLLWLRFFLEKQGLPQVLSMDRRGRLFLLPDRSAVSAHKTGEKYQSDLLTAYGFQPETGTIPEIPDGSEEILQTLSMKEGKKGWRIICRVKKGKGTGIRKMILDPSFLDLPLLLEEFRRRR